MLREQNPIVDPVASLPEEILPSSVTRVMLSDCISDTGPSNRSSTPRARLLASKIVPWGGQPLHPQVTFPAVKRALVAGFYG